MIYSLEMEAGHAVSFFTFITYFCKERWNKKQKLFSQYIRKNFSTLFSCQLSACHASCKYVREVSSIVSHAVGGVLILIRGIDIAIKWLTSFGKPSREKIWVRKGEILPDPKCPIQNKTKCSRKVREMIPRYGRQGSEAWFESHWSEKLATHHSPNRFKQC